MAQRHADGDGSGEESDLDQGIQLKVQRQMEDQEMTTQTVQEIA